MAQKGNLWETQMKIYKNYKETELIACIVCHNYLGRIIRPSEVICGKCKSIFNFR